MESGINKTTNDEKDEAAVELLKKLQQQLHSSNASIRRRAAFNLSWLQEDGLAILKSTLFSDFQVTTKNAAAYGLRKMQGRMRKKAKEVLVQGLTQSNSSTSEICVNALQLLGREIPTEFLPKIQATKPKPTRNKSRIREIPSRTRPRRTIGSR